MARKPGFSLVELVIVVVIIATIAAIAVPRISQGAKGAGEAALRGSLAAMRNAIDMYSAEHNGDYPGADSLNTTVVRQLTTKTDITGAVGTDYGPYLRRMPPVPVGPNAGGRASFYQLRPSGQYRPENGVAYRVGCAARDHYQQRKGQ